MMKAAFVALIGTIITWAFIGSIATAQAAKFDEKVLYSFCNQSTCADGARPSGSLIAVHGKLYGTTRSGGAGNANNCGGFTPGCGTVFSIDPSTGAESVVYSFCNQPACAD